jgi:hypothetical protein
LYHSRSVSSVRSKITVPLYAFATNHLARFYIGYPMLLFLHVGHFAVICCGCN